MKSFIVNPFFNLVSGTKAAGYLPGISFAEIEDEKLRILHSHGFFSNCSVGVYCIIEYMKRFNRCPAVDWSRTFSLYKDDRSENVYENLFSYNESAMVDPHDFLNFSFNFLSSLDYSSVENYEKIGPLIRKWFSPSDEIGTIEQRIMEKYSIELDKTLCAYYRGSDKWLEVKLPPFKDFSKEVRDVLSRNSHLTTLLIQSDQQQFIDYCFSEFSELNLVFIDENPTTRGKRGIHRSTKVNRLHDMKIFLATVLIMSKCAFVVNTTSNVSRWIYLYRGNSDNTKQLLGRISLLERIFSGVAFR